MNSNVTETANSAKLTGSIIRTSGEVDGLPVTHDRSFTVKFGSFGPMEMKKALADSEVITSILREYPTEMTAIINDILAGRIDAAKATALKIGLTEDAFQKQGGGMIFLMGIALFGGFILTCAAIGGC